MDDQEFLQKFETATWPHADWHHREHIKMAYLYLKQHPLDIATQRICNGIRAYNAAQKIPESLTGGYHETMTQAWTRLVHLTLCEFGPSATADEFVDKHTQLLSKRALLLFYSRDRIMSAEAKYAFIQPDLAPLPRSIKNENTA